MTPPGRLLIEAVAVAAGMSVLFLAVHACAMAAAGRAAMTNHALLVAQVAVAASLFHVGFEVTGLNAWYCRQHPK